MFFKKAKLKSAGFSLLELLSAASITAVLSVVGIKSYQSQTNKAKQAEAQQSLSYLYSAQTTFHNNWKTYHENLLVTGLVPKGALNYDFGFTTTGHSVPDYPIPSFLGIAECSTVEGICDGGCIKGMSSSYGGYGKYFSSAINCELIGIEPISGSSEAGSSVYNANPSRFKALATEKLRNLDLWSINEKQELNHELDGS